MEVGCLKPLNFMQRAIMLFITVLFLTFTTTAQTKIITGKVINRELKPVVGVVIQYCDTTIFTKFDINGLSSISIPVDTKSIIIGAVGFESASIDLTDSCQELEIVLLFRPTYDFITLKKADKLRMKEFKQIPSLHFEAYQKGIFQSAIPCYTQHFIPDYDSSKSK